MSTIMKPTPQDKRELNLNTKIKLPKDRYGLRIKDEEFKFSKSGNPMVVLTFEFVSPDTFTNFDGSVVNIAGVEVVSKMYLTLRIKDDNGNIDEKSSQKAFDRYCDIRNRLDVPVGDEGVDIENPPKVFKGLVIDAIVDTEEATQRKEATPEQKAQGKLGDEIKDNEGKPIRAYFTKVIEILGRADSSVANTSENRPY